MLTRKPRIGDEIRQPDEDSSAWKDFGVVVEISGNICHVKLPSGRIDSFIWKLKDGLNTHFQIALSPNQQAKKFFKRYAHVGQKEPFNQSQKGAKT